MKPKHNTDASFALLPLSLSPPPPFPTHTTTTTPSRLSGDRGAAADFAFRRLGDAPRGQPRAPRLGVHHQKLRRPLLVRRAVGVSCSFFLWRALARGSGGAAVRVRVSASASSAIFMYFYFKLLLMVLLFPLALVCSCAFFSQVPPALGRRPPVRLQAPRRRDSGKRVLAGAAFLLCACACFAVPHTARVLLFTRIRAPFYMCPAAAAHTTLLCDRPPASPPR